MTYSIELIWNREFNWCHYKTNIETKKEAVSLAKTLLNSGGGERVKRVRVVDWTGKVVWF